MVGFRWLREHFSPLGRIEKSNSQLESCPPLNAPRFNVKGIRHDKIVVESQEFD